MSKREGGKSRQDRSGLARIAGAGKPKARELPHVPQKITEKSGKTGRTQPGKRKGD